ncbi:HD domain-containing phosphohydrolase [Magnetococcales bacterium HHB-1]
MSLENDVKDAQILIIDDQPANVKLLEKLLLNAGFTQVDVAIDPREGLKCYTKKHHDLVLLDIRMPHLNGFQVMEKMRDLERDSYIPVLVLTAQTDRETRERALEGGAKDFLTKPFDRVEVLSRIQNMLKVRLLHKQVRQQNQTLEARVRERTQELEDTRLDIVRRLGRAAEYRDNETGYHIVRMSRYAELLATRVGCDTDFCHLILHASPMHDVGKIGIPDHILKKPGALTPEEWTIMKTHTTIGGDLLADSDYPLLMMAREIALTHHEQWSGGGYPNGLSGEEIPLAGRITAISDVFDALTSKRPYKEAWPEEKAIALIKEQAGRQFDPTLVDLFLSIIPEVLQIKKRSQDPL